MLDAKETGRAAMLKTLSFDVPAGSWMLQENFFRSYLTNKGNRLHSTEFHIYDF